MTDRRYNDEEVAAIFERASKAEHANLPARADTGGLTLAALQEIGREVGIPPESITSAARSLDLAGRPASRMVLGLPIGVGRTVEFDRPLSDADWERLVADLRETFRARGTIRYDGPFRQWTNGNLQALLEPTQGGHRLRLQTLNGGSRTWMAMGTAMLAAAMATTIAVTVAGTIGNNGPVTGITVMAVMGLGLLTGGALRLPAWARRRRAQFEEVTTRLALSAGAPPPDDPASREDSRPTA